MDSYYTNQKYNFRLTIPASCAYQEYIYDNVLYLTILPMNKDEIWEGDTYLRDSILLTVIPVENIIGYEKMVSDEDFLYWYNNSTAEYKYIYDEPLSDYWEIVNRKSIGVVDEVKSVSYILKANSPDGPAYFLGTWFRKNNMNYHLEIRTGNEERTNSFLSPYQKIVSSFKFIE